MSLIVFVLFLLFILVAIRQNIFCIVPVNSHYAITPRKSYYERLEVDELGTYVGNKSKKYWLIYACERKGG